jgi:hypothetical protein
VVALLGASAIVVTGGRAAQALTTPTLMTQASIEVAFGFPVSDTADLENGINPTGSISFALYGPDNATCTGTPVFSSVTTVSSNGTYPSGNFVPTTAGTYRWVASYEGDVNNAAVTTACDDPKESVIVDQSVPFVRTTASIVGDVISDTASVFPGFTGGVTPPPVTGTITFNLYYDDAACNGTPLFTSTTPVDGYNPITYPSGPFTATASGVYRWVAVYSGDVNNVAQTTGCQDANESVVANLANLDLSTQASTGFFVGDQILDTATLAGGNAPTGTLVFSLYGPGDTSCGSPLFTSSAVVAGDGSYTSDPFTTAIEGTYRWQAAYSGDGNNAAVITSCADPDETVQANRFPTSVGTTATQANPTRDTASLFPGTEGAFQVPPTGTITFSLYGPNDATCTGPAVTSVTPVNGSGDYLSDPTTVTASGTYRWVAAYSGDAANAPSASGCNDDGESVTVTLPTPTLTTTASGPVTVGGPVSDTATLNGVNPTGTITFTLVQFCGSSTPLFISTTPVTGNGSYTSDPFIAPAPGTYFWLASYSGDANNAAAASPCGATGESVDVTKATTALVTEASGPVPVGGSITDTATLSGGANASGTIVFTLFGPDNATCAGTPIFTSTTTSPVNGPGSYTSDPFPTTTAGTYQWIATYNGDANNEASTTACGDPNESIVVGQATPAISTQASGPTVVGGSIRDSATLSAGVDPTGTITFNLYGPGDATCGNSLFVSTSAVNGNGIYSSGEFTALATGTYQWVASYSGDANNASVAAACDAQGESVTVSLAAAALTTAASAPVRVGGTIHDTATLSGGVNPSGLITFNLYGPGDTTCAAPLSTSTAPVNGNGTYSSARFTATIVGTYRWVASYSGDSNNGPATAGCNDSGESVVVRPLPTTTTTVAATTTTIAPVTTTSTTTTTIPTTTTTTTRPTTTTTSTTTTTIPTTTTTTTRPTTTTTQPTTTTTRPRPTTTTTRPRSTTTTTRRPTTTTTRPPTTTSRPPATTTIGSSTTLAPTTPTPRRPVTTRTPPTTARRTTTATTRAPARVVTQLVVNTTLPPTTTTTVPPTTQPPPPPPTIPSGPSPLIAVTPDGVSNGRAGVGLSIRGSGYRDCKTVYFFVDSSRVGSGAPDSNGNIRIDNLSIPGDTSTGQHRVTSSCLSSGKSTRQSTLFRVTHSSVHRSAFVTAIPRPDQISLNAKRASLNLLLALLIIPLLAFPSELFNSTLEENYNEVRGWFGLPPKKENRLHERRQYVLFAVLLVVSGVLYSAVSPDFGLNRSTFVLAAGLGLAVIITGIGFALPSVIYMRRRVGEWGRLKVLPGTLLVGVVTVGLSRLLHLQPGYIYGLLAVFVFRRTIDETQEGRLASGTSLILLLLSIAAWLALIPISAAAAKPHSSIVLLIMEACIGGVFLIGLESLLVDLLPMRFLDGSTEIKWSKSAWAALFGFGVFALIQVLLTPNSGYVGHTSHYSLLLVIIAYVAFGLFSFSFWGYFRYRTPPPGDESAEPRGSEPDWMVQG